MPLLSCRGLSFSYERSKVLEGVSFDVMEGSYLAVVGENGAGKSTLIKGILGLKLPSEGRITLCNGLTRRDMGYLPQHTQVPQQFPAGVDEIVLSGCLARRGMRPYYSRKERTEAREHLEALGIGDLWQASYKTLSGGQQQRVLLARATFAARRLLVLDEPVTSLDPNAISELYSYIRTLNRQRGLTVVMVSHDVRAAVEQGADILHLNHHLEFYGSAEDYRESAVGRSFLGGIGA